jgi:hypothetical protein
MKRTMAVALGLGLVAFVGSPRTVSGQTAGGWTTLFDGSSLNGWNRVGDANWELTEGAVQASSGKGGFLVTAAPYSDFELTLEFWVTDDANSGVFIRCSDPKTITAENAYEVNIYDKRPNQDYRTGGIVNVAKPLGIINTGGKWNTYTIRAEGPKLTVTLNGTRTVDVEHQGHMRGPIALQYGSGTVKFRNVRIRPL